MLEGFAQVVNGHDAGRAGNAGQRMRRAHAELRRGRARMVAQVVEFIVQARDVFARLGQIELEKRCRYLDVTDMREIGIARFRHGVVRCAVGRFVQRWPFYVGFHFERKGVRPVHRCGRRQRRFRSALFEIRERFERFLERRLHVLVGAWSRRFVSGRCDRRFVRRRGGGFGRRFRRGHAGCGIVRLRTKIAAFADPGCRVVQRRCHDGFVERVEFVEITEVECRRERGLGLVLRFGDQQGFVGVYRGGHNGGAVGWCCGRRLGECRFGFLSAARDGRVVVEVDGGFVEFDRLEVESQVGVGGIVVNRVCDCGVGFSEQA